MSDINGWDLKKVLKHFAKGNATLFEWSGFPIVYSTTDEWAKIKDVSRQYFFEKAAYSEPDENDESDEIAEKYVERSPIKDLKIKFLLKGALSEKRRTVESRPLCRYIYITDATGYPAPKTYGTGYS